MEGSTYVPVMARSTFSAPENGSEIDPGGGTTSGYYINWNDSGFTGRGWWYIEKYISYTGFPEVAASYGQEGTYSNFVQYVGGNLPGAQKPENLNNVLGDAEWDSGSKNAFINEYISVLGITNVQDGFYGQYYDQTGCIDALSN